MMKRIVNSLLVVLLGCGLGLAVTQSTSTVVKVTCTPGLSISIDIPEYSFDDMAPGEIRISGSSATITNDSLGRTADYTIDCSTFTSPSAGQEFWTINPDGNPGQDQFSMQVIFKSSAPVEGNFDSNDFMNDTSGGQNMKDPSFTENGSNYDGNNVHKGQQRLMWFRMHAPSGTSTQAEQRINVTITAEDAGTF